MRESPDDLARLQTLLDRSIEAAGAFLRASFEMPEHSLSAAQLAAHLTGVRTVALATVTARSEPRVAPVGGIFYRGRFAIPTVATAARARHVAARPAISLTYYEGNDLAILAHGHATTVTPDAVTFTDLEEIQRASEGSSVREWGEGIYMLVEAETLFTYARHPERFPTMT